MSPDDPSRTSAMSEPDTWDFVIIGGGPPGENLAQYAIQGRDATAVIVEQELVGGECSYWACMPSKALLRPVALLDSARHVAGVSELVGDTSVDAAAVLRHRDEVVSHHDDSSQVQWAQSAGIDVVRGRGRLAGTRTVEVETDGATRTLHARHAVVLAAGTSAQIAPVPGLREALPWTSRDVTNCHELPRRVAVVGGGVVACEASTWLLGLGVQELTVVVRGSELLERNEPFAGELVRQALAEHGATVHLDRTLERVERPAARDTGEGQVHGGPVHVHFGGEAVEVDEIVVAMGRVPRSRGLGLESVETADGRTLEERVNDNHGFVAVDDHLAVDGVDGDWLYAVGDINGRALLTHMGKYQARICGAVLAARAQGKPLDGPQFSDRADHAMVPQVTFTDPEVASVGRTEQEARDAGIDVEAVEYDLAAVAGTSLLRDDYRGRAKIVIDRSTNTLVGATFVGPEVADLLHGATIAVAGHVNLDDLWHAVPAYPTPSEVWLRLLETRKNPG